MEIEHAIRADWPDIKRIYIAGIRTGHATFQTVADVPDGDTWFASKIDGLIFKTIGDDGRMLAWAALSHVSSRRVYAGVAEVSIYVDRAVWGQGVGSQILRYMEAHIMKHQGRIILVETSSSEGYQDTCAFYEKRGYLLESRIRDFYKPGDDRLIYTKHSDSFG